MKFLRAQGHFGVLSGQKLRFEDGLNVIYLPNEGGKSTLCSFLRVMLYGLNTSRRDGKNQLSDKTKYRPVDGAPMSGILELEWQGRPVMLSRQTGKGTAPMQEFSAHYADTGAECPELTSKDCGYTLTGVSEEGYQSSALLDGQEQALSAKELGERMLALSTTGDSAMVYGGAVSQLDRWRNALRGTGNRGRYAEVEAEIHQIDEALQELDELDSEIHGYELRIPDAEQAIAQAETELQQATEDFTLLFVAKREAAEREERKARENLAKLRTNLPPASVLKEAERAKEAYTTAKEQYRAAADELHDVTIHYQQWRDDIDRSEDEYSRSKRSSDIHIRGWSMIVAVVFGVLAVISLLGVLPFGALTPYMPYIFSLLAIVALIVTFMGSTKTLELPPMDFDEERIKLERRKQNAITREAQISTELTKTNEIFWENIARVAPEIPKSDEPAALEFMMAVDTRKHEYIERKHEYEDIKAEYLDILDKTGPQGTARVEMEQKRKLAENARHACSAIEQAIAGCRGKAEGVGSRGELKAKQARLKEELENILWQVDAIRIAKEALIQANAALTGRVSPMINQLAQEYLRVLTGNRYTALELYTNFEATCRGENSAVEMDRLRLSTGTRDQLYLALRLAVCKVLLDEKDESIPLVLDDPFVNYDEERTACGMKLLREIARERQVILLTCRRP